MAFIAVNLDETQEQKAAPKGAYELQITAAQNTETGENSKHPGAPMLKVMLGFTDLEVNAPAITHYITLPYEGDENASFKLLMLKRFLSAFSIPYNSEGIDTEALAFEMIGHTGTVEVELTEPNDNGDVYNRIKVPRLRDEMKSGTGKPPRRR
jgi:hypothetical protein